MCRIGVRLEEGKAGYGRRLAAGLAHIGGCGDAGQAVRLRGGKLGLTMVASFARPGLPVLAEAEARQFPASASEWEPPAPSSPHAALRRRCLTAAQDDCTGRSARPGSGP